MNYDIKRCFGRVESMQSLMTKNEVGTVENLADKSVEHFHTLSKLHTLLFRHFKVKDAYPIDRTDPKVFDQYGDCPPLSCLLMFPSICYPNQLSLVILPLTLR